MAGFPSSSRRADRVERRSAFIHQEVVKLVVLIAVAIAAFFVTRAIAASNRATAVHDAAEWYGRGERALAAGNPDVAVEAFRHASVMKRGDRQYALALARALLTTRQIDAARGTLLTLREAAPEDPEINLELARLEAAHDDVTAAVRYYHNALYAPWPAEQANGRRQVRLELIRFLISHHQSGRAESELVALSSSDLPDDLGTHLDVGSLFLTVGDARRALEQLQQALRLAPRDGTALAGAGRAAFAVGDYALAQRYLRDVPSPADDLTATRTLVDLVLSNDPLAARIGGSARRARLLEAVSHVSQRLESCIHPQSNDATTASLVGLRDEGRQFSAELSRGSALDNDTIESGLELVDRAERAVIAACPPEDPLDRALMLIAERHGISRP